MSIALASLFNADLLGEPGKDAVCVGAGSPATVTIPVGQAAEALTLHWTARGPATQGMPAAFVDVRFADGASLRAGVVMGDEVGAPGQPGRHAIPEVLGTDSTGAPVLGKAWALATGRPSVPVTDIVVTTRVTTHSLCLTALEAGPARNALELTDTHDWYAFVVGPSLPSPLPQALPIEGPAGAHGKVTRGPDGHLVFADGARARFWGVDLFQTRAMPPKDQADAYAATLANLGFNIVRLHHIDLGGVGLVNPKRGEPGQPPLVPEMQDRLDYFLSRLKAHGVYLFLEAATFRELGAADGVNNPGSAPNGHKLVPMWEDDWFTAYVNGFRALWDRTNPYTGMRYADDPMVAIVELSNEHSLLANWGPGLEGLATPHLAALDARWNQFLRERYPDDAALAKAWAGGPRGGLQPGESLAAGTVRRDPVAGSFRTAYAPQRTSDLYAFYAGLERSFYQRLSDAARKMGFAAPTVASLNYGRPDLLQMYAGWQVQDMHFEWDYPGGNTLRGESILRWPRRQGVLESANLATDGLGFSASELNEAAPNPYMAEAPLLWATMASVQDWDAIIWNSYALGDDPPEKTYVTDPYDLRAATVKLAQNMTASSLFRGGWVTPAQGLLRLWWSEETARLSGTNGPQDDPAELSDIGFWLSHRIRSDFGPAPVARTDGPPTPGVGWWVDPGILVLDRPEIQVRIGPAAPARAEGAGPKEPSGLRVTTDRWAAVSLATTDGAPLATSRRALLTIGTRQENTGMAWEYGHTRIASNGVPPVLVEPFVGDVAFRWPSRPVVRMLGPDGTPTGTVEAKPDGKGWWKVHLDATVRTPMLLVESGG